jgi:hypothetical protein
MNFFLACRELLACSNGHPSARLQQIAATQSLTPTQQAEDKVSCRMEISTMGKYMELTTSKYIPLSYGLLSEFY